MINVIKHYLGRVVLCTTLLAILYSCTEKRNLAFSFSVSNNESFPSRLFSDVSIIELDTTNFLLYVRRVEYINNTYYVLANNGLFMYSDNGQYLGEISRKGRAEQEWLFLDSFYYSAKNQELCLIDCATSKIMHFSMTGEFLFSKRINNLQKYHVSYALEGQEGILLCNALFQDNSVVYAIIPNEDSSDVIELESIPFKSESAIIRISNHPISSVCNNYSCIMPVDNQLRFIKGLKIEPGPVVPVEFPLPKPKQLKKYKNDFSVYTIAACCLTNKLFCGYDGIFEVQGYTILTSFNRYYTIINNNDKACWILSQEELLDKTGLPFDDIFSATDDALISVIDGFHLQEYRENDHLKGSFLDKIEVYLSNPNPDYSHQYLIKYTLGDINEDNY